ncbi:hypothetical protein KAFR_0A01970 [Kazachstania africana CBS 2517]|uniref:BZIP domain-containing protein n=1 Tax=Kazachstania africana (strain ATCC 22294 / BCRC 22015 / CBS 2517 / CECT 1963 / NBRC 1671 / NRRL Y-8276) TaxID=1071382 RepID=H2AMN5_KAZAF|nr:hypothetical protein KAFR_0A01970 [Kazachstania africana CBS 2517]CCF55635.1 hypothetical protein KAFR_0A01970 [Kazachstania africana CBS 2517]
MNSGDTPSQHFDFLLQRQLQNQQKQQTHHHSHQSQSYQQLDSPLTYYTHQNGGEFKNFTDSDNVLRENPILNVGPALARNEQSQQLPTNTNSANHDTYVKSEPIDISFMTPPSNLSSITNWNDSPSLSITNNSKDSKAKKKAQNRAAQKAFRERKEARLKELETKLMASERDRKTLLKEIEELRKLNMEINAENRILLQKNNNSNSNVPGLLIADNLSNSDAMDDNFTNSKYSFPSEDEFFKRVLADNKNTKDQNVSQNARYTDESGRQLLTVPATWEYLNKKSEEKDFDVSYVMQRLKGNEACDEYGPAYPRSLIDMILNDATIIP